MAKPSYQVLDSGLYKIGRAEVLLRKIGTQEWFQMGDVDTFVLSITPTKVARYRKNAATRTKAKEIVNQIESNVSFRCMQFLNFIRAVSVLGDVAPYTQSAVAAGTYTITAVKTGSIYRLGALDVTVTGLTSDSGVWVAGTHYKVVDAALGMIQIIALPATVEEGDEVEVAYTAPAITAAEGRVSVAVASQTEITVEMMVRDVGRDSIPQAFNLFEVTLSPSSDVSFIDEDDFAGVDISGSAVDTNDGVGVLFDLAA